MTVTLSGFDDVTVYDQKGEPVVVERIEPHRYFASGWAGGVGRYAEGATPDVALQSWVLGRFLPLRERDYAEAMTGSPDTDVGCGAV